jgi:hypothetical protein
VVLQALVDLGQAIVAPGLAPVEGLSRVVGCFEPA